MIAIDLREVEEFHTTDPKRLSRELSQFEDTVTAALAKLGDKALPVFAPTPRKTSSYAAKLGEFVEIDPTGGNIAITLPVATQQNKGQAIAVARRSASNTVTASAVSGNVNGSSSYTLAATAKLFLFISDGVDWWGT